MRTWQRQGVTAGAATYSIFGASQSAYSTPTDLFAIINPAASGKVLQVRVDGVLLKSSAASLAAFYWIKRTALDTGGTPSDLTVGQYDSSDAVPVGIVRVYTAAPTITDTSPKLAGQMAISPSSLTTAAPIAINTNAGGSGNPLAGMLTDIGEPVTLRPGEELVLSYDGGAWPAGGLYYPFVQWTESSL